MSAQGNIPAEQLLVLLEEVAQSNRAMADENRNLRAELERRERIQSEAYKNIEKRLETMTVPNIPSTGRNGRRRGRAQAPNVVIPIQCRRITKKIYATLKRKVDFHGFNTNEGFTSDNNTEVCERVIGEVYHKYSGEQNCPWKRIALEAVLQRYFVSLCEKQHLVSKDKYDEHKKMCRKSGRRREKLGRRTVTLERINQWDVRKKSQVAEVLVPDAMSSEESCTETDEEGRQKVVMYKVKKLPWESRQFSKLKRKMDKEYRRGLSKRARDRILHREYSEEMSDRKVPDNFPEWAIEEVEG